MELEEIFFVQEKFLDKKGIEIKPESKGEPKSIKLTINDDETDIKRINSASYNNLEINAYCKGVKFNNDKGTPIQFYKI